MARPRTILIAHAVIISVLVAAGCSASLSQPPATSPLAKARSSTPDPTPTPASFPDEANTGVPNDTDLTPYTGGCAFEQSGMVVQDKIINCDRIVILAPDVTIRSSQLHGWIDISPANAYLTLEDSDLDAANSGTPAIGFHNVTVRRTEIRGGQTSVQCSGNCLIEDSLLHDQMKPVGDQHLGGYLSNGGSDVVFRHNTVECTPKNNSEGGGCTGSIQIFGDFESLVNFRFEHNLVKATPGGFCASFGHNPGKKFGSNPNHIAVIDNVFERGASGKCGVYGATTSFFAAGKGNVFSGNTWDDGSPMRPNT